jgi:hypothetical protein
LIPKLTRQLVAFTNSSERQGYLPALESASKFPIQYLTLFRKGPRDLENTARRQANITATDDGILVPGKDFFCSFHIDAENGNDAISAT